MISYFLSNISAKNYRNRIVYVKIIASRKWDVFWDTVYITVASDILFILSNADILPLILVHWDLSDKRAAFLV